MANTTTTPDLTSHQTALAILPPAHLVDHVNTLREAYDKAYHKWPAHINLLYPFVHPDSLHNATSILRAALDSSNLSSATLKLDETGYFTHKHNSTIYICPAEHDRLRTLHHALFTEFSQNSIPQYNPHLTVGQAGNDELRDSLRAKARLLPTIEWPLEELAILVRGDDNVMRVWATIPISTDQQTSSPRPSASPNQTSNVSKEPTYQFSPSAASWIPCTTVEAPQMMPPSFRISSYNVLVDSIYPPAYERFGILVRTILSESARSDVLVLQEVSDDFLCHLLRDDEIRSLWPYVSHAPPDQGDVGPLLSLRNIVVLSRWSFDWEMVTFERRHKGAVVVKMKSVGKVSESGEFSPLVIAGVHLTCGLTDGSVAAKKSQLRSLLNHLSGNYADCPWMIAGDFNVTTSTRTIEDAIKTQSVSAQTVRTLSGFEQLLSETGFADAWAVSRSHHGPDSADVDDDDLAEGEQGATFDPRKNPLAAEIVGHGLTHRPQRYDRILLKGEDALEVANFNTFGHPDSEEQRCGSDHWGVRATIKVTKSPALANAEIENIPLVAPPAKLNSASLQSFVTHHSTAPTAADTQKRREVFSLLEATLQQISAAGSKIPLVVVPVGSYGLGAWNAGSDIDCLCISSVSSKTFFTLAVKNLRKAAPQGVRILRKVEAHSGTMLELDIQGIKLDLQYCAAARIADCWPTPLSLPPTNALFSLPLQTLSKLKAIRDLAHLLQTTPDLPAFRVAYRFLVIWAMSRGVYAARFGFLSGSHISLMLDRVAKLLYHNGHDVTAAHLVCTFFEYYADFDWAKNLIEDPLTRSVPGMGRPYQRHAGEPMVVLGYHVPRANIARAATVPAVTVLAEEFKRANQAVKECAEEDSVLAWTDIAGDSASEFLAAYKSYIRIDVQYWGKSSVKGRQLVGWVESRCPQMLVDLNRKVPEIHGRMWPMRFTRESDNESGDQYGCYLIGLAKRQDAAESSGGKDDAERKLAQNKLDGVLERFSEQIRGNENFFDPASAWVEVKQVGRAKLEQLVVDRSDWGSDLEESWEFEDEEDEDEDEMDEAPELDELTEAPAEAETQAEVVPRVGKKLRPATDILNRLRWDPNLNSADYVVGYVDRFLGTREIALDRWKVEQTDEEFIPQHRILYFKRRSDGVRVWDREARLDVLSGNSS
ncbi:Endonuclease/exonuclease/phosphatase [Lasiodiplodia theobromae]|uniref:polynucleotide adenylyltransferase n=1 Tax=Lasiodiplodia theobromae TaxID=45133 RepID=A0A8H7IVS7_9PEZI|nr:Endonuclease/exonuclease/phosphatase [Lasiodiplodia theobromae]